MSPLVPNGRIMHPSGELISEKPSGRGCYVQRAAAIIDLPITQAQRDSSSNTAIIRRMVRFDAMCRAFAAAYHCCVKNYLKSNVINGLEETMVCKKI